METLRILWLNWRDVTNPAAGGAELYTHQVAMRWARGGHEVTLFTSRYSDSIHEEDKDGVRIVRMGNTSTAYLGAPRFFAAQRRKGIKYDVVIDAINTVPFFSELYAKGPLLVALVYQLTGEIFLKEFSHAIGHLLYALERRSYLPWYLKRAERVVTLSDSTKAELVEVCPELELGKVCVVPPGVDHDHFAPGSKSDEPLLLFMNRFVKYKQPEHAIIAMKEVSTRIPNARLIMVGTIASTSYADDLRRLVRTNGLESKVTFLLSKPFASGKVSLLQRAWVHILPSLKEGFGISILEAGACGTPTVGYNVSGVRDAVNDGKTGILVRSADPYALAAGLIDILTDYERLRILAEGAANWATSFSWDETASGFMSAMRS